MEKVYTNLNVLRTIVDGAMCYISSTKLFVCGGGNSYNPHEHDPQTATFLIDVQQLRVDQLSDMNGVKSQHGIAKVGENVYVFGGAGDPNQAETHHIPTNQWTKVCPAPVTFGTTTCAVIKDLIYIACNNEIYLTMYDPSTDVYTSLERCEKLSGSGYKNLATDGEKLYLLGHNFLLQFDTNGRSLQEKSHDLCLQSMYGGNRLLIGDRIYFQFSQTTTKVYCFDIADLDSLQLLEEV